VSGPGRYGSRFRIRRPTLQTSCCVGREEGSPTAASEISVLEFHPDTAMSSNTKSIYEEYIKPLSREDRHALLNILQAELQSTDEEKPCSILELHGLGKEIWQGVDANEYVRTLRDE
jgi:hypothetical protein